MGLCGVSGFSGKRSETQARESLETHKSVNQTFSQEENLFLSHGPPVTTLGEDRLLLELLFGANHLELPEEKEKHSKQESHKLWIHDRQGRADMLLNLNHSLRSRKVNQKT